MKIRAFKLVDGEEVIAELLGDEPFDNEYFGIYYKIKNPIFLTQGKPQQQGQPPQLQMNAWFQISQDNDDREFSLPVSRLMMPPCEIVESLEESYRKSFSAIVEATPKKILVPGGH
jgi:hypothetical protein